MERLSRIFYGVFGLMAVFTLQGDARPVSLSPAVCTPADMPGCLVRVAVAAVERAGSWDTAYSLALMDEFPAARAQARRVPNNSYPQATQDGVRVREAARRGIEGIAPPVGFEEADGGLGLLSVGHRLVGDLPFLVSGDRRVNKAVRRRLMTVRAGRNAVLDDVLRRLRDAAAVASFGRAVLFAGTGAMLARIGSMEEAREMLRRAVEEERKLGRAVPGYQVVTAFLAIGDVEDALNAVRQGDPIYQGQYFAQVARALLEAGDVARASAVIEEGYSVADALPSRMTLFGTVTDVRRFYAYELLLPLQARLAPGEAVRRAAALPTMRLVSNETDLSRATLLAMYGHQEEGIRQLERLRSRFEAWPAEAANAVVDKPRHLALAAAALFRAGAEAAGIAVAMSLPEGWREIAGAEIIAARECDDSLSEVSAGLTTRLGTRSAARLLLAAAVTCLDARDDVRARRFAAEALRERWGDHPERGMDDLRDVAWVAFAAGDADLVKAALHASAVQSHRFLSASRRASALAQDAALATEMLHGPP